MTPRAQPIARTHCDRPMIAVEVPEIYDGTCYWQCEHCAYWEHRFGVDDPRRKKVDAYVTKAAHP